MSLPPLSKVRCCRSKKIGQLPEGLPQQPLATHQPIQNRTILLSFRRGVFVCACMVLHPCLVSRQCRCVLQRLSVADFKHPCLKLCAHTLKASVPCLPLPLHRPSPSPQPSQNTRQPFTSRHHPRHITALPFPHHPTSGFTLILCSRLGYHHNTSFVFPIIDNTAVPLVTTSVLQPEDLRRCAWHHLLFNRFDNTQLPVLSDLPCDFCLCVSYRTFQ